MSNAADPQSLALPPGVIQATVEERPGGGSLQPVDDLPGTLVPTDGRGRWIRLSSRVGLWGVAIGLVPLATDILTSTWLWSFESLITEVGFLVGGAGILATAGLVLKEVGRGLRPVKLAALAGVPLGVALLSMGAALLLETAFPPTPWMARLFMAAVPAAALLGVLVLVLLVVGFFSGWSEPSEE